VKAVLEADELEPARLPACVLCLAGELEQGLVGLRARVAEEGAVQPGERGEQLGQGDLGLGVEDVGGVPQPVQLGLGGGADLRVAVAEGQGGDATEQIEIDVSVGVPDPHALPALENDGLLLVVLEQMGAGAVHHRAVLGGQRTLDTGDDGLRNGHGGFREYSGRGPRPRRPRAAGS